MRMRRRDARVRRNYDKVLLAVYVTADDAGLVSYATNTEIGDVCNLAKTTVPEYLRKLESDGVIATFRGSGFDRIMILMDHPDSANVFKRLRRIYGFSDGENRAREERETMGRSRAYKSRTNPSKA